MDVVEEAKKINRAIVERLKQSFLYQLKATQGCTVKPKTLWARAIEYGICPDYFNISDVVNELIRENLVDLCFVGDELLLAIHSKAPK